MTNDKAFLRELCDLPVPDTIKISPDGSKVLYSTQLSWGHYAGKLPVSTLWLASTNEASSARKITSGHFKDHAPAWSPDGQSIAFISDRADAGNKWAIYMAPTGDLEKVHCVTTAQNEQPIAAFSFSPDGKFISYLSTDEKTADKRRKETEREDFHVWGEDWNYTRLRTVNLETKETRTLDIQRHVLSHCWSPDGKSIGIVSSNTSDFEDQFVNGTTISILDMSSLQVTDICSLSNPAQDLTWPADGNLLFRYGRPGDKLYSGSSIYKMDSDGSYERVEFGVHDDAEHLTEANGRAIAKVDCGLESRICLSNGSILYNRKQEIEAFDVSFVRNADGPVLVVATSDINHPVEVYSRATKDGEMIQLSNHGSKFKGRVFGSCEILACPTGDENIQQDAMFLSPPNTSQSAANEGPARKPLPTVVLIHGGPATRLTESFNTYYYMWAPYLLSLGYAILIPNYRGSSGRGAGFAAEAIGAIGVADYADIIAVTDYAVREGLADKDRLLVAGASHGGFLSLLCSVRNGLHGHGWHFKASIANASICDSDSMALTSDLGCVYQPGYQNGRVAWNMDAGDTRNRIASPIWEFHRATEKSKELETMVIPPILLLHGEEDRRCPVTQAWGMRRALESQKLPFQMVTYPRQGHFFTEQSFWIDMAIRVGRWCDRYIGDTRRQ